MVLEKRRQLWFIPPPMNVDDDTEVGYPGLYFFKLKGLIEAQIWEIPETGEIFSTYEAYLERRDYYDQVRFAKPCLLQCFGSPNGQKIFSNAISGHMNMTFWEANKAEQQGGKDVDQAFPEALREPILRRIQFSTQPRIDVLISSLFSAFEKDILVGEKVVVFPLEPSKRRVGVVRDKATFSPITDRPEMVRYFVQVSEENDRETVADSDNIMRLPRSFSKQMLRLFLKHTVFREKKEGAPWIVKEDVARAHGIPTELPPELDPDFLDAERRARFLAKKHASQQQQQQQKSKNGPQKTNNAKGASSLSARAASRPRALGGHFQEISFEQPQQPAPPPIKYPIEDTQLDIKKEGSGRPPLKFLAHEKLFPTDEGLIGKKPIEVTTVGLSLEIWNTLNVFNEHYLLDGFTYDDFVGAMTIACDDIPCELFTEIHCAVLRLLVNEEGDVLAKSLKDVLDQEDESSSASGSDSERSKEPSPVRETIIRTPRKRQDNPMKDTNGHVKGNDESTMGHRVEDVLEEDEWIERLQKREFAQGGWAMIMLGLIEQMEKKPAHKAHCERAMRHLAPANKDASQETVYRQYMTMDVNLRIAMLQLAMTYTLETKQFKDYMENCMKGATETRKTKLQAQTDKKHLATKLADLERKRKLLRPDRCSASPDSTGDPRSDTDQDTSREEGREADADEDGDDKTLPDSEDDSATQASGNEDGEVSVSNRRSSDRSAGVKRKREEVTEPQPNGKRPTPDSTQVEQFRKVVEEIEEVKDDIRDSEEHIDELEEELRENAAHRTKLLGKDRYFNYYYWFERNGMPFEGDPESSTASYGYANGRLWIQGPDKLETDGIVDLNPNEEKRYRQKFGMTLHERRNKEEGPSHLNGSDEYAYYDTPEELDKLIAWLDNRGEREKSLRKELTAWRKEITKCMRKRMEHRDEVAEKQAALEDRVIGIATRKKTTSDLNVTKYPCTAWRNTMALNRLGYLHVNGRVRKASKNSARKGREPSAAPEKRTTRQGTRFAR